MISNEEDKDSIEKSIQNLTQRLNATGEEIYNLCMKRKFLNHQIADLQYKLRYKDKPNND